jgi:hypothetical protein
VHEVDDADQATSFLGLGLAGDRQLALDKVPLAKALNQKLRGFLATSGAKIFNMTQRFDGGYVQVSSYNGIERAFIYAEPTLPLEPDDLATAQILSGVVKDADLVVVSPPLEEEVIALRGFKPTAQTWGAVFKRDPDKPTTSFNDEPRLAVKISTEIHYLGEHLDPRTTVPLPDVAAQYKEICSSMYSGLMAKAVQVILGYGKLQSPSASETHRINGVQVKYNWRWAKCHGIVRGAGSSLWLVEISVTNGVLAMPLPMFKNTVVGTPVYQSLIKSKQDVLRETALLFGGLPSGGTFPTGMALTEALASGDVIRLATAAHMAPFFDKSYYSSWMGWSFNLGGVGITPQAHNTCFKATGTGSSYVATGYHYKLVFNIARTKNRKVGQAIGEGNATLSLVGSGRLAAITPNYANGFLSGGGTMPAYMVVHDGDGFSAYTEASTGGVYERVYCRRMPIQAGFGATPLNLAEKTTLIACHVGNTLDKITLEHTDLSYSGTASSLALPGVGVSGALVAHRIGPWDPDHPEYAGTGTYTRALQLTSPRISFIRGLRCKGVPAIQRTDSREQSETSIHGHIGGPEDGLWLSAASYHYTEEHSPIDTVFAWSAFARDGYLVHEPCRSKLEFTGTLPGAFQYTYTYTGEPFARCVTPHSRNVGGVIGVDDLRIPFNPNNNRKISGFGSFATLAGLNNSTVTPGAPHASEIYGQKHSPYLRYSTFGRKITVVASVPFRRRVYLITSEQPGAVANIDASEIEDIHGTVVHDKRGDMIASEDIANPLAYSFIGYI